MEMVTSDPEEEISSTLHDVAKPLSWWLFVVVLLAVDDLNPVKILCSYADYFQGILGLLVTDGHIASIALALLVALGVAHKERLLYFLARLFFRCTFNNMFFSSIEIVGTDNLPKSGPIILTGNHNNQFVDGVILLTNCDRQVSFMIAQKSFDRPVVGFLAKAFHCIPVSRPQDIAFTGAGTVLADGSSALRGEGTSFIMEVKSGSMVELAGESKPYKVKEVASDTLLLLETPAPKAEQPCKYKVHPKVDQSAMFSSVFTALKRGRCLGIFPEGGSHDRTDLLPLKAGVAIIALDALHKHHMHVPIVPVGLNYFKGHRFGGRVVVEFGPPIVVPQQIYAKYETDRHGAVDDLLQLVSTGMRSVIVPTPDYHTLQQIYMARRLFVPDGLKLSAEQTMDLNRRFAIGLKRVFDMRRSLDVAPRQSPMMTPQQSSMTPQGSTPNSRPVSRSPSFVLEPGLDLKPEDIDFIDTFKAEVEDYMSTLKRLGLRDHQVRQIGWWGFADLVGRLLYLVVTLVVGAIPQLLFNLPVMTFASKWAAAEQKKALKASSVKIAARDVLMSYKVIYVLTLIPILYIFYGTLIVIFCRWSITSVVLCLAILPFFAFLGMKASDQGVRAYTDIVPLFMRFFHTSRQEQDRLPERRARLQKKLHAAVKKFGPMVGGDLNANKPVDWAKEMGWFTHAVANEAQEPPGSRRIAAMEQLDEPPVAAEAAAVLADEGLARRPAAKGAQDVTD